MLEPSDPNHQTRTIRPEPSTLEHDHGSRVDHILIGIEAGVETESIKTKTGAAPNMKPTHQTTKNLTYCPMPTELRLFGTPAIKTGNTNDWQELPNTKPVMLLMYLAALHTWVSRNALAAMMQPENDDANARHYVRVLLNRAKEFDWTTDLETQPERLRFPIASDLQRFREAIQQNDWALAHSIQNKPFLEGLLLRNAPSLESWVELERHELSRAWTRASIQHANNLIENQQHQQAIGVLEQLLKHDPLQEDVMVKYMQQCANLGLRQEAIRSFEIFRQLLETELGLSPMPETLGVFEHLKSHERIVPSVTSTTQAITPNLLRPPHLRGRSQEQQRFWASQKPIRSFLAEAGAGKTRMLEETATANARWWRCREGLEGVPYQPIIEWINANLKAVPELGAYREDLARLIPEIAPNERFGPAEPGIAKQRLLEAIARVFEAHPTGENPAGNPAEIPAEIIVDDLQWIDTSTLEVLVFIAARNNLRLTLAARKDELTGSIENTLNTWRTQDKILEIELPPLRTEDLQDLIRDVSGASEISTGEISSSEISSSEISTQAIQQLITDSGGNAFFALETLRDRLEHQTQQQTQYPTQQQHHVPNKIKHLIEQRIKRLPETTQRSLQAASVMREAFTPTRIASMIGISEYAALDALEHSERAGLTDGTQFRHDLVRQSLYATLPELRRNALHARAAKILEGQAETVVIAEHWAAAGEIQNAVQLWHSASSVHLDQGLAELALQTLERALHFCTDSEWIEWIELDQSYLHLHLGNMQAYDEITERLSTTAKSSSAQTRVWMQKAIWHSQEKQHDQANTWMQKATQQLQEIPNDHIRFHDLHVYATEAKNRLAFNQQDFQTALEAAMEGLHLHTSARNTIGMIALYTDIGAIHIGLMQLEKAYEYLDQAWQKIEKIKLRGNQRITVAGNLVSVAIREPKFVPMVLPRALQCAQSDPEFQLGDSEGLWNSLAALYYRKLQDNAKAFAFFENVARNGQHPVYVTSAYAAIARIGAELGHAPEDIHQRLEQAIEQAQKMQYPAARASTLIATLMHGSAEQIARAEQLFVVRAEELPVHPHLVEEYEQLMAQRRSSKTKKR
jgi:DNA-binding SARP family transcriptional activator